jgi:hypothetical protein
MTHPDASPTLPGALGAFDPARFLDRLATAAPEQPEVLRVPLHTLSAEQAAGIASVLREYRAAVELHAQRGVPDWGTLSLFGEMRDAVIRHVNPLMGPKVARELFGVAWSAARRQDL